jgi:hypothetical protein
MEVNIKSEIIILTDIVKKIFSIVDISSSSEERYFSIGSFGLGKLFTSLLYSNGAII